MGLVAAIAKAQELVAAACTGIREAPDYPPEQMNDFPFLVAFPGTGTFTGGPAGMKKGLHAITMQLHIARKNLPRDVEQAAPYIESIVSALMVDPGWGGTVDSLNQIDYRFGPLGWGIGPGDPVNTFGVAFTLHVKLESAT